ncbi:MAG TPA: hypothetical protein VGN26_21180 [Armatimonadota bacterium]|jgi:predicted nucleotidyltransferase
MTTPQVHLREHHRRAIEVLTDRYRDDPAFDALLIAGSVAKGTARDDSDVDALFIATDEESARRQSAGEMAFLLQDLCDYPGGYVDCKVLDRAFLRDVEERGSEPARSAFLCAYPAFSRLPGLAEQVRRIAVYPEAERRGKIDSFYAQMALNKGFFWSEAEKRGDPYLLHRTAAELVLYGGRLILAHNRILFPCHKRLMEFVEQAPERPEAFVRLAVQLLAEPTREHKERFCACVEGFTDWGVTGNILARYIADTELTWRTGTQALSDC